MTIRKGERKEDWDYVLSLASKLRVSYIINRYLKKVKISKYSGRSTKKEDREDFKELVELGLFDLTDLLDFYNVASGKKIPELDEELEAYLYSDVVKKSIGKVLNPKTKKAFDDFEEIKKALYNSNDVLKSGLGNKSGKIKMENDIPQGSNKGKATMKKVGKKTTKESVFDIIKKELKEQSKRESNIPEPLKGEEKDTRPMWKREQDAEYYNSSIYQKEEEKRKKRFQAGKAELGKLMKDLNLEDKLIMRKKPVQIKNEEERKREEKRKGKLPLGKRLRDIADQELTKKKARSIKYVDTESKEFKRQKRQAKKPKSPVSSPGSATSIKSSRSSRSTRSISGYDDEEA